MTSLLIKGGRIVDPATSLDAMRDLRVRDGRIAEIGGELGGDDDEIIDAAGAIVAPGFIDMHVHLRDPGFPEKETLATGTEAAVRGGFTTVACMPNTNPALDDPAVLRDLMRRVELHARCRVLPIGALTRARAGVEPCDFRALADTGAVAFSDDGDTVKDERVMHAAAVVARDLRAPFISHCEPEDAIVARDLRIASETGKVWHIAHVSTGRALSLIRGARARGERVTCEVTPHHLTFTGALAAEAGAPAKVNPPLRDESDVTALREGVRDGTIDAFASDHAPHPEAEKRGEMAAAAPGFSGLEVAVGAYAAALPDLPLRRFIELLATNPARILGIPGGSLAVGAPGDVTIFADRAWTVDPRRFASKGRCTPFAGRRLPRRILATVVAGRLRYRAEAE
ncbi:MAG: dihydroorotase [Candidatus Eremiobacteraeota bacterium]|nr:dihydroorotase [Candidatus Eremiobacteraeota bacterium]